MGCPPVSSAGKSLRQDNPNGKWIFRGETTTAPKMDYKKCMHAQSSEGKKKQWASLSTHTHDSHFVFQKDIIKEVLRLLCLPFRDFYQLSSWHHHSGTICIKGVHSVRTGGTGALGWTADTKMNFFLMINLPLFLFHFREISITYMWDQVSVALIMQMINRRAMRVLTGQQWSEALEQKVVCAHWQMSLLLQR